MAIYNSFRKPKIINTDSNIPLSIKKIFRSQMELDISDKTSLSFGDLALINKENLAIFIDGEYKLIGANSSGNGGGTVHKFNAISGTATSVNVKNGDYVVVSIPSSHSNSFSLNIKTEDNQEYAYTYKMFVYQDAYRWWESTTPEVVFYITNNMPILLRSPYESKFSKNIDVFTSSQTNYNQYFYTEPGDIIDIRPSKDWTRNFILYQKASNYLVKTVTFNSGNEFRGGKYLVDKDFNLKQIVEPLVYLTSPSIENSQSLITRSNVATNEYALGVYDLCGGNSINISKNTTDNYILAEVNLASGPVKDALDLKADKTEIGSYVVGEIIQSDYDPGVNFLRADGSIVSQSDYPELFNEVGIIGDLGPSFGLSWNYISGSQALIGGKSTNRISKNTFSVGSTWINRYFIPSNNGLFYSDDGEIWTWIDIPGAGMLSNIIIGFSYCLAVSPSGVFKSSNHGIVWTKITDSLPHPNDANIEYGSSIIISTGSYGEGIIKRSADYGNTWSDISIPEITGDIRGLVSISNDWQTWVILRDTLNGGVYKSTDNGLTWTRIESLFQVCPTVEAINIENNNNWLAFGANKLYRSTDAGLTWTNIITFSGTNYIRSINGYDYNWVIFTTNSNGAVFVTYDNWNTYKTIYATHPNGGLIKNGFYGSGNFICVGQYGAEGIYVSKKSVQYDHLVNFKLPTGGSKGYIRKDNQKIIPAIKPDIDKSISEVLLKIQDIENELPKVGDILTTSRKPSSKYLSTNGELIEKEQYHDLFKKIGYIGNGDDGSYDPNLWAEGELLFTNEWKYPWAATTDKVNKVFIIVDNTVFKSIDAGLTWTEISPPTIDEAYSDSIKYINGKLFVGYNNGKFDLSLDDGKTWTTHSNPDYQTEWRIKDFLILDDNTLIVAGISSGSDNMKIIHDSDPAWHSPTNPAGLEYMPIYSMGKSDSSIIACNRNGIFRSTDGGMVWTMVMDLSDITGSYNSFVKYHDGVWILIKAKKILRSTDDGLNWTEVYTMPFNFYGPFDVDANGVWMVGSQGGTWQTIRSEDNGLTWTNLTLYTGFKIGSDSNFNNYDTFNILINVYPGRWISNTVHNGDTHMFYTHLKMDYDQSLYFELPLISNSNNMKTYIKALP